MRQYVDHLGKIEWEFSEEPYIRTEEGTWKARIPEPEEATKKLDFAKMISKTRGVDVEGTPLKYYVAVPNGVGGFFRVEVELTENDEWIEVGI